MTRLMTEEDIEKDVLKNKKDYIGKIVIDKNNTRWRIVDITKEGLSVVPDIPAS